MKIELLTEASGKRVQLIEFQSVSEKLKFLDEGTEVEHMKCINAMLALIALHR